MDPLRSKSESLKSLAQQVSSYNSESNLNALKELNQKAYDQFLTARSTHDMDPARVVTNNVNTIHQQVNAIQAKSQAILAAYEKAGK